MLQECVIKLEAKNDHADTLIETLKTYIDDLEQQLKTEK